MTSTFWWRMIILNLLSVIDDDIKPTISKGFLICRKVFTANIHNFLQIYTILSHFPQVIYFDLQGNIVINYNIMKSVDEIYNKIIEYILRN